MGCPLSESIRTKVVGVTFRNSCFQSRQGIIARHCRPGDRIQLRRERHHKKDRNAIAVRTYDGKKFGYLSRALAFKLADEVDRGYNLYGQILDVTGGGGLSHGVNIEIWFDDRRRFGAVLWGVLRGLVSIATWTLAIIGALIVIAFVAMFVFGPLE